MLISVMQTIERVAINANLRVLSLPVAAKPTKMKPPSWIQVSLEATMEQTPAR